MIERSLTEQFHHLGLSRGILDAGAGPLSGYVSRVGAEWEARVRSSGELAKAHAGLVRTALAALALWGQSMGPLRSVGAERRRLCLHWMRRTCQCSILLSMSFCWQATMSLG